MAYGKSYEEIRQALRELGITRRSPRKLVWVYKIGRPRQLEPEGVRQFAGRAGRFIVEESARS